MGSCLWCVLKSVIQPVIEIFPVYFVVFLSMLVVFIADSLLVKFVSNDNIDDDKYCFLIVRPIVCYAAWCITMFYFVENRTACEIWLAMFHVCVCVKSIFFNTQGFHFFILKICGMFKYPNMPLNWFLLTFWISWFCNNSYSLLKLRTFIRTMILVKTASPWSLSK